MTAFLEERRHRREARAQQAPRQDRQQKPTETD